MRLHAQIFGLAVGRPVYGLSFEPKCDEFLSSVGVLPVRPEEVSADELALAGRSGTGHKVAARLVCLWRR